MMATCRTETSAGTFMGSQSTKAKESLSQYIRYGYDAHKPKRPYALPFNPIISKHGKKLTHMKSEAQLSKYHMESNLD
jgi:hypothetical protein